MNYSNINWLAVLVSALSTFVIGALWYSPALFAKPWMKACGFTEEDLKKKGNLPLILVIDFILTFVMAMHLAWFLKGPTGDVVWGMTVGAVFGISWIGFAIAITAMFERRSCTYILIHGGYFAVSFIIMGAILGAWR